MQILLLPFLLKNCLQRWIPVAGQMQGIKHTNAVLKEGWQRGLHLDHVVPLSKGGSDLIANVKPSHAQCNLKKNNRMEAV